MSSKRCQILGLRFFRGTAEEAVATALAGGLVVAPSAPVLVELRHDPASREALLGADLVISDSGLMVLMWRLLGQEWLPRVSGLEYLRRLLRTPVARAPAAFFWIMPTADARERAVRWLRAQGIPCSEADCYVAPKYGSGPMEDWNLLHAIRSRRPKHVVIAIGGGTQERLGLFLKLKLDYRPGIHCIGAAIGFLIGDQVRIPRWADSLFLGWLFRCISEPTRFVPRYWRARKLVAMMWRYRDRLPEIAA